MNRYTLLITSFLLATGFADQEQHGVPGHRELGAEECSAVSTAPNFDLTTYTAKPWYVHQQMEVSYLPKDEFFCVRAQYEELGRRTFPWGYQVRVKNEAQDGNGRKSGTNGFFGSLCAYNRDKSDPAKLAVAPCFLPRRFAGDYWVIAHNEAKGYALITGGQPTIPSGNGDGLCKTGTGTNNSGIWIFTRSRIRDDDLIKEVRKIAEDQGIDTSVLLDVDQSTGSCSYERRLEVQGKLRGSP